MIKHTDNYKKVIFAAVFGILVTLLMAAAGLNLDTAEADQLYTWFEIEYGETPSGVPKVIDPDVSPEYYESIYEANTVEEDKENLTDNDYFTSAVFGKGSEITINASEPIDSLYIMWEYRPGKWTLRAGGKEYTFGKHNYIHEYVEIPDEVKGVTSVTLVFEREEEWIDEIYAFSAGPLPEFVQIWEPMLKETDILLISTHADDEILFFGSLIPTYIDRGDVRIQLAYFSNFEMTEPYRNHEILNGLWSMGITNYPKLGEFRDYYSESIEEAEEQYDHDECLEYIVRLIRGFKPQVLISHDVVDGEYGHGCHIMCSQLIEEALEITDDPSVFPYSYNRYGGWDVPKTYFHLYPENQIEIDARVPLAYYGGMTALEVARAAYDQHQSQSWMWFKVYDSYDEENIYGDKLNCTKFGLYRTLVGYDTSDDILENVLTASERTKAEEEEALRQAEEQASLEEASRIAAEAESASIEAASIEAEKQARLLLPGGRNFNNFLIIIITLALLVIVTFCILVMSAAKYRKQKKMIRMHKDQQRRQVRR